MSDSLQPHGLQHARLPCPSTTPGVYSNSCPSRWWCHPNISSSVVPFSSHLQSFPGSGSFQMSQFYTSGGQSIGSFSFSISPSNEYSGLISFRIWRREWQTTSVFLSDIFWFKRCLLLGRKVMTNLDSIFKSRDITLPTKVCLVKAMVFPVVTYGCESWTIKKAEHRRIDAFELWCWIRL